MGVSSRRPRGAVSQLVLLATPQIIMLLVGILGVCSAMRMPVSRRSAVHGAGVLGMGIIQSPAFAADPAPGSIGSRVEELKTLGVRVQQSTVESDAEFWSGRLQGRPPPDPKVVLRDAPPIVILPGFGNDAIDYIQPNGQPKEVGLVAALSRRGVGLVAVVPIMRSNWLNVARGLTDVKFATGDAQPEGPAFSWYVQAAKQTVEETVAARRAEQEKIGGDPRVVLLGHSAGGWLARALCVVQGDEWARRNVRGVVTLGAPHASPPPEVADQTRGTIPNINRRAPGAYLAKSGVFYVTVSSARVVGDADGDASAQNAFTAYKLILGRSQGVKGDGFVPIEAAFLDGATQLTLDCFHSGGSADPWPKDDWYGAERNVDAWLGPVAELLKKRS